MVLGRESTTRPRVRKEVTRHVAWGDLGRFAAYAATLNSWAPASVVPAIVWFVTVAETCLGSRHAAIPDGALTPCAKSHTARWTNLNQRNLS
jgi:hypothetical protein